MAKRFIHDELLRNPWLRAAPTLHKLLWIALVTECDHAGIWVVDWPMMELLVGGKIDPAAAKKFLGKRILEVDGGARWFLPDFIKFQYQNGIQANNNCLKSVRQLLDKYGIDQDTLELKEGLANPSPTLGLGLQEKEKDKEDNTDRSVPRARPTTPAVLQTDHRGSKVDWYDSELQSATDGTDKNLAKLKKTLGDSRYATRLSSYKDLVSFIVNGDPLECPDGMGRTVMTLKDQLKFLQYSNLADIAKGPEPIRKIVLAMHNNYAKSLKGKTSVYCTARDWLNRELAGPRSVNGPSEPKSTGLSIPKNVPQ